jgi:transposase-like protein
MVRHRTHGIEFKRQIVQDYLAGDTRHGTVSHRVV